MRQRSIIYNLTPILLLRSPVANAQGAPPNPFVAPFLHLDILVQEGIDPTHTVNVEVYGVKGKAGYRPPLSLRFTGIDSIQIGELLVEYGRECLKHERE